MNCIELIGNVGKDPEIKTFDSGKACMRFSVATSANFKPKEGEAHTNWHNVIVWGKLIDRLDGSLRKGSRVFIKGEMEVRRYTDKNGQARNSYDVRADLIYILEVSRGDNRSTNGPTPGEGFEHERYD